MSQEQIDQAIEREYAAGFVTDIESDTLEPGLNEDVIRFISAKKDEPEWLLEWRLQAYRDWLKMIEPEWAHVHYPHFCTHASVCTSNFELIDATCASKGQGR